MYVVLLFAPVLIVLERLPIVEATQILCARASWLLAGPGHPPDGAGGRSWYAIAALSHDQWRDKDGRHSVRRSVTMRFVGATLGHRSDRSARIVTAPFSAELSCCYTPTARISCRGLRPGIAFQKPAPPAARPVESDVAAHAAFLKGASEDRLTALLIDIDREAAHQAAQHDSTNRFTLKTPWTKELTDWIETSSCTRIWRRDPRYLAVVYHHRAAHLADDRGDRCRPDRTAHHAYQPRGDYQLFTPATDRSASLHG